MRSTIACPDVVDEREDVLRIGIRELKREFDFDLILDPFEIDDWVECRLVVVQVLDELGNPFLVMERLLLLRTLVRERDRQSF